MTNDELGDRLGVSHAMASRLRNGKRLPSVRVMGRIHEEFGTPVETLHEAHRKGRIEFGKLLRRVLAENGNGRVSLSPPAAPPVDIATPQGAVVPDLRGDRRSRRRRI